MHVLKISDAVKQYQSEQHNHTCLMPQDMAAQIVVNNENTEIIVPVDNSDTPIKVAPGEGVIPTNPLREENMEVKAFVRHHPSGRFGFNYPREIKLSPSEYFIQRLMNADERFSKDAFYVFMAAAIVEKHGLERHIDICGVKGKIDSLSNGEIKVHLNDAFGVFKKIKGTPKYWQTAKNELIAKVKQLGPFHLFYTFSCGKMRWSEVFLS